MSFLSGAVAFALASADAQDRTASVRLVYFDPASGDPSELYCAGEGNTFIKVTPAASVAAEPLKCPVDASGKIAFTRSETGDPVAATATIPNGVDRAILFLVRNPPAAGTKTVSYRVLTVDESSSVLPPGGTFICNLAAESARVTLGEHKYQLLPGKPARVRRPAKRDAYNMAAFLLETKDGDAWSPLKDTTLRFSESERYFVFIHPVGPRTAVKIYKQVVRGETAAPAEAPGGPDT